MKSLRETLAGSHVAAVAIAALVFYAVDYFLRAFQDVLPAVVSFIATAMAIRGMPYVSSRTSLLDQLRLLSPLYYFFVAVTSFASAGLLSRWVYGVGLLACLRRYRPILARRSHV